MAIHPYTVSSVLYVAHFRRRTYMYYIDGQPLTELSSFESLSNYNHFIRWYDDATDGAEDRYNVNCEV